MPRRPKGRCAFVDDSAEESDGQGEKRGQRKRKRARRDEEEPEEEETEQDRAMIDDSVQRERRRRRVVITAAEKRATEDDRQLLRDFMAAPTDESEGGDWSDSVHADSDESDVRDADRGFVVKSRAEKQADQVERELKRLRREAGALRFLFSPVGAVRCLA